MNNFETKSDTKMLTLSCKFFAFKTERAKMVHHIIGARAEMEQNCIRGGRGAQCDKQ
jgi:hypothetical protein